MIPLCACSSQVFFLIATILLLPDATLLLPSTLLLRCNCYSTSTNLFNFILLFTTSHRAPWACHVVKQNTNGQSNNRQIKY